MRIAAAIILTITAIGCAARENVPHYPRLSVADSLKTLREHQPNEVTAEGTLKLVETGGRSIQFDAVIAMKSPDHVRLRAWKFGQAVFDLTSNPDGTWFYNARGEKIDASAEQSLAKGAASIRSWLAAFGDAAAEDSQMERIDDRNLVFIRHINSGRLETTIERSTLAVRKQTAGTIEGETKFEMVFDRYQASDSKIWPKRVKGRSAQGIFTFETREFDFKVAPGAFNPPHRSKKIE